MLIDHVTIAGASLEDLRGAYTQAGLAAHYGGAHSNGITHMDVMGFPDGTYLELISSLENAQADSPWWHSHIQSSGGPCAWAVRVNDLDSEVERLRSCGIFVDGPGDYHRARPDGQRVEWRLAFPGEDPAGATLPFLIEDRTPRELRVETTPEIAALAVDRDRPVGCVGVVKVVLGVTDLQESSELFQRAYGWSAPRIWHGRFAAFAGSPVILAAPGSNSSSTSRSLRERLNLFGPSPCGFLIGVEPELSACQRFPVAIEPWLDLEVAWLEDGVFAAALGGWGKRALGFVEFGR